MLVKPLKIRNPFYFWPLILTFLTVTLLGAKLGYDKFREPPKYVTNDTSVLVRPADEISGEISVKKPGGKALLPGARWVPQTFNNCGPATTSMILQYFGHNVDQTTTQAALRTNPDDKNVFTYEIAEYLRTYNIDSKLLFGGNTELLKTLIANGFYVMVEDWLHPNEDIGHVTILRGFDDEQEVFIADDSFIGVNVTYPYEEFDKTQWKPFNREYLPIYKPGNEELLQKIVGESWNKQTMYEKATEVAQKEISLNDKDMYAWFNLGTSYYALENFAEARKAFERSYSVGWPKRMLWYQIQPIQNYNALGEYDKAIELANLALTGNESFAEAHLEKAVAYLGLGELALAERHAKEALKYAPNLTPAQEFLKTIDTSEPVLGLQNFGPVGGTPLIPPSYLTVYFAFYIFVLVLLYIYFYRKRKPVLVWHKVKLLVIIAAILKASIFLGTTIVAAYWLVPSPGIRRTLPQADTNTHSPIQKIEIVFDRPINRNLLEKSISPEIPGRWVFENSLYTTHLYRKLVFYPTISMRPDTNYTINLGGIQNMISLSDPYDYQFSFRTRPTPKVLSVSPISGQTDFAPGSEINVTLSQPNDSVGEFYFEFQPQIEFSEKLDSTLTRYTLTPKKPLNQGTEYRLKVSKTDVLLNLEDRRVVEQSEQTVEYDGSFTTLHAPGITSFEPQGEGVLRNSTVKITFSKEMNRQSVIENFTIEPMVNGQFVWIDNSQLEFRPTTLAYDINYQVKINKGAESLDGSFFEEDILHSFKTIGPVRVSSISPANNSQAANIHSAIRITFDQEVDQDSAREKFSITPEAEGSLSWSENTLTFTPKTSLSFTTLYAIKLDKGIRSINGLPSDEEFNFAFKTQDATTRLSVPAYLQKYTLSCELASLKMTLAYRGIDVSEDTLLSLVGVDNTPHSGNTWGNPNSAFVGNVRGTQMVDGYGVHWGPIARVARMYRSSQEFQGWNISQLTSELEKGNPVVIWVYAGSGIPTNWTTPDGTNIYAVRDEHAVVAVGYVGKADNPTQMIINDPLSGQVYWSRASFDRKWNIFNNSGVVVY